MRAHLITARNSHALSKFPRSQPETELKSLGQRGAGERGTIDPKLGAEKDLEGDSEFRGWSESKHLNGVSLSKERRVGKYWKRTLLGV